MISFFRNLSIKHKLSLIVMGLVFLVISIGSSFAIIYFVNTIKDNMVKNSLCTIQTMSQDFVEIIAIGHAETSVEVAKKLKSLPEVRNVYIYNLNDEHVFGYKKSRENFILPPPVQERSYEFRTQFLELFQPIIYNNKRCGTVYLRLSTAWVQGKIASFIKIVVIFLAGLIGLYFLISTYLLSLISRPILNLSSVIKNVSQKKDYSLRIKINKGDEIGLLSENFNMMMKTIHTQNEELYASKEMLQVVLNNIPQFIFWKDRNSVYLGCNNNFVRMAGCQTAADIIGKTDYDLAWKKEEADFFRTSDDRVMSTGQAEYHIVEKQLQTDGKETWLDTNKIPLLSRTGNIVGILGTYEDITDRKRLESELLKSQKIESLGVIAGGIAHDFNNILTAVIGNIDLAKMGLKREDKMHGYLTRAENASEKARVLTKQLLTFAKGGEPVKETVSIAGVIEESVGFSLRGSKVICDFSIAKDLYPVDIDKGQISQVINNLIINADQAMPEGGVINVKARNITEEQSRAIIFLKKGRYVHIGFKDNGCGIPDEYIAKIFDPYFTTKTEGSGLGLASSYSIIKRHKGLLSVESTEGTGTTFHIYLNASLNKLNKEVETKGVIVSGKGKILLMDDDKAVLEVTGEMLRTIGYEVEFAKDGHEAIALYRENKEKSKPFDIVVMDLTIPGRSIGGEETIKNLLEIDSNVNAIVCSGYSDDKVLANFKEYGFKGVLHKPFKINEITDIFQKLILDKS